MDLFEQRHIAPMLIADAAPAFDDPDWIYEIKWDGTRCIAYLDPITGIHLENKRFKILNDAFPELQQIHHQVRARCILDGELFVYHDGRVDFAEMQRRSLMTNPLKVQLAAEKLPVSFVAFDILYCDGRALNMQPLMERKQILQETVNENERIAVARYLEGRGVELYHAAEAQGLEGVIAKRRDSLYIFGKRSRDWVKFKNWLDDDFVVCGYYHKADNLLSVILGQYAGEGLQYQGHVVMGVSREDYRRMQQVDTIPKETHCDNFPEFEEARWLQPELVCKVEYMERTARGGLRQPAFRGIRDDKQPGECRYHG